MSSFAQPGIGGDKFTAAEHNGSLLLFYPTEFRSQIPTANGATDAVSTTVINLDTGQVLNDAMVFGSAMVPQLKGAVDSRGMVLGRLGQGQNTKGNPPWILSPHTAEDVAKAEAYIAANPRNQFQNPAPSTPVASAPQATAGTAAQAAVPAAGGVDPQLVMKLVQAGVPVTPGMTQEQLVMVAQVSGIQV